MIVGSVHFINYLLEHINLEYINLEHIGLKHIGLKYIGYMMLRMIINFKIS